MPLLDLIRKYTGSDDQQETKAVIVPRCDSSVAAELPRETNDWPPEWRRQLAENVKTFLAVSDMPRSEAEEAAVLAIRCEFIRHRGVTPAAGAQEEPISTTAK